MTTIPRQEGWIRPVQTVSGSESFPLSSECLAFRMRRSKNACDHKSSASDIESDTLPAIVRRDQLTADQIKWVGRRYGGGNCRPKSLPGIVRIMMRPLSKPCVVLLARARHEYGILQAIQCENHARLIPWEPDQGVSVRRSLVQCLVELETTLETEHNRLVTKLASNLDLIHHVVLDYVQPDDSDFVQIRRLILGWVKTLNDQTYTPYIPSFGLYAYQFTSHLPIPDVTLESAAVKSRAARFQHRFSQPEQDRIVNDVMLKYRAALCMKSHVHAADTANQLSAMYQMWANATPSKKVTSAKKRDYQRLSNQWSTIARNHMTRAMDSHTAVVEKKIRITGIPHTSDDRKCADVRSLHDRLRQQLDPLPTAHTPKPMVFLSSNRLSRACPLGSVICMDERKKVWSVIVGKTDRRDNREFDARHILYSRLRYGAFVRTRALIPARTYLLYQHEVDAFVTSEPDLNCHYCGHLLPIGDVRKSGSRGRLECPHCHEAMYCSSACLEAAARQHHSVLCYTHYLSAFLNADKDLEKAGSLSMLLPQLLLVQLIGRTLSRMHIDKCPPCTVNEIPFLNPLDCETGQFHFSSSSTLTQYNALLQVLRMSSEPSVVLSLPEYEAAIHRIMQHGRQFTNGLVLSSILQHFRITNDRKCANAELRISVDMEMSSTTATTAVSGPPGCSEVLIAKRPVISIQAIQDIHDGGEVVLWQGEDRWYGELMRLVRTRMGSTPLTKTTSLHY